MRLDIISRYATAAIGGQVGRDRAAGPIGLGAGSALLLQGQIELAHTRVLAQPDPSKVREFADDIRDGKFALPIGRRLPLRDAAQAQVLAENGGAGKIILLAPAAEKDATLSKRIA